MPYRNPFEVCLSSIFQNQHIYEIYFGKLNSIQIIQKILDRISRKESLFYGLFLNMQIGVGFYEREINNTLCSEKKIFLRQGKNSLDNLTVYFLPIDKEEHAIYEDESVGWLNPVLWPKENMTQKKPFGDVYMESLDAVKFSDQAVSEIKKCLLFQLGFSVEYQKKLIKKFKF
ncbi:MAG: hypothetical protein EBR01_12900 [Proteobacteria bacterium]|nr:hypothetical protein [Pseudomonadota bacterium]